MGHFKCKFIHDQRDNQSVRKTSQKLSFFFSDRDTFSLMQKKAMFPGKLRYHKTALNWELCEVVFVSIEKHLWGDTCRYDDYMMII